MIGRTCDECGEGRYETTDNNPEVIVCNRCGHLAPASADRSLHWRSVARANAKAAQERAAAQPTNPKKSTEGPR